VVVMLRVANTLAWTPTVIAVGSLGLPEEGQTAQWVVAHVGTIDGTPVLEARTTLTFLVLARATLQAQRRGWTGDLAHRVGVGDASRDRSARAGGPGNPMTIAMARSGGAAR